MSDVIVISPVEHLPGFLPHLQPHLLRERSVHQVRVRKSVRKVLAILLLECGEAQEKLREDGPEEVADGGHQDEPGEVRRAQ